MMRARHSSVLSTIRKGVYRMESGELEQAETDLARALDAGLPAGARIEAWLRLARLAAARGETDLAEQRLRRCLELAPDHPDAMALLQQLRRN